MSSKRLDTYKVLKTIGRGRFAKVKAVQCIDTQVIYAAKIFVNEFPSTLINHEVSIMGNLTGPGIVRIIYSNLNGMYVKSNESQTGCKYILMELCVNGDLFDLTIVRPRLSIQLIQVIFHQILSAVQFCHNQNVFHRDLKPENILFDQDFQVKLTDFGSAFMSEQEQGEKMIHGKFTPPEVNKAEYRGDLGDIFSLGCILFYLVTSNPPFNCASMSDNFFRSFVQDPENFWKKHMPLRRADNGIFSLEFKDLIGKMISHDPDMRPSIDEIRQHPWFGEHSYDLGLLRSEIMQMRKVSVEELKNRKESRIVQTPTDRGHRSLDNLESSLSLSLSLNEIIFKKFSSDCFFNKFTQIRSCIDKKTLLSEVNSFLIKKSGFIIENSELSSQIKVNIVTEVESLDLKIAVYEMEESNMVNFKLLKGSNFELMEIVKEFVIELGKI